MELKADLDQQELRKQMKKRILPISEEKESVKDKNQQ
jgi:hypothetical protein